MVDSIKDGDITDKKIKNFIRTTDEETAKKLSEAGFKVISYSGGATVFLNDPSKPMKFETLPKAVLTNQLFV